jgi:uncharacterized protein (DUF1778 family)
MRILSSDIQSDDGVANAAIAEAAQRLEEQQDRIKRLEEAENRLLNWLTEDCPEKVKKQLSNAWIKYKEAKP